MATKSNVNAMFLDDLFSAARLLGEVSHIAIDVIRAGKINWSDKARVKEVSREFILGRIAGSLGLDTRVDALVVLEKKGVDSKTGGDDVRTMKEHMAWRAAVSAWSTISLQAGKPKGGQGKRQPKAPAAPTTQASDEDVQSFINVKAPRTTEDIAAFALRVADMIISFENKIGTVKAGEYREHMDTFVANVRAIAVTEKAKEETK